MFDLGENPILWPMTLSTWIKSIGMGTDSNFMIHKTKIQLSACVGQKE